MCRIIMPGRIIDQLEKCLIAKEVQPVVNDVHPDQKSLEVGSDNLRELGECLQSHNSTG